MSRVVMLNVANNPFMLSVVMLSVIMNGPNKLECLSLESNSSLVKSNTLAYWTYLLVAKEFKCCEYGPMSHNVCRLQAFTA
jgi:hypothetical protein